MNEFVCKYCGKICKNDNSLRNHERLCHLNPNRQESSWVKYNKKRGAWNKGLTAETDERLKRQSERTKEKYRTGQLKPTFLGKHHTEEAKYKLSKSGGYRKGSGRGKSGWYKGIYCGSTWELAFLIYHLDNNLNIKRCTEKREYVFEGKIHSYLPDFVTDDGIIEIKGYISKNWEAKYNFNPDIKVLYKKDIKKYLDYVHNKYGCDLTSLYDNSNPKQINKKRVWIHKGSTNTWVAIDKLQRYLDNGYIRGQYIKSK